MRSYVNDNGLVWWPIILALVILALIVGVIAYKYSDQKSVVAVESGKCTCEDLPDLRNRLNEVNAAISEYQLAIGDVQSHDTEVGSPTMYNEGTFNDDQANVQIAINGAHTQGTRTGSGDTGTDCGTKVDAPTACLKGSIRAHENVHATTCQQMKSRNKLSWNANYKDSMTMIEYWNDEIAGYQAEISYLNAEIAHAASDRSCVQYECKKGSGVFYETAGKCNANCVRKIASLDNWCWEYNPRDNTYTGKKY
jgi:hypothetical protein